ncbi:TIGR01212 family radical SAM protein [Alkalibacter rhizosphaerae]|uniref:TIGR01212 family radical SAM protein n=1 Tax=Alkalibacter rhizosphaerae TaxID=2815577 RepID=A0A974XFX4_9FIRM|nr:TIGR01212 family radical SAM protein [Alkalibacter rhizosphaerae]QSX07995.1 TIGR01212 family radical SAM protein [Alkalibacter rhizosphaerae]
MENGSLYHSFADAMMEKYGEKVYKIPISISRNCPNRDGILGVGGCSFCGESGAGHETLSNTIPIKEQFQQNASYIQKKYKAKKFIPYFQDFTNTYMDLERFRENMMAITDPSVVGIAVSTRPDCIDRDRLEVLKHVSRAQGWDIYLELGLQSVNYKTLKKIDRGHSLAEFIDALAMIRPYGFDVCAHMILNLPWDDMEDVVEGAKVLSALQVDGVKLHALYIEENTKMAMEYTRGDWPMISLEEYVDRVVAFLCWLSPEVSIHRLIGRAPKEGTLFVNWNRSWWVIRDQIEEKMKKENLHQGIYFDYLGGKGLQPFR